MSKAVIGVGTNMGDRILNIKNALNSVELLPDTRLVKCSRIFETEPWGYENQQNFYNCCILVETSLSPKTLLGGLLGIEAGLGRVREFKNGPRIIDLDLLLYDDVEYSDSELTVPHPGILQRAFVLCPLKDLFEDERFNNFDFSSEYKSIDKNSIIATL